MSPPKDLLEIKAFSDMIVLEGFTYYDSHSRLFNIVRLPSVTAHFFPNIRKRKMKFEIRCFPTKETAKEYLDKIQSPPLILQLFERPDELERK